MSDHLHGLEHRERRSRKRHAMLLVGLHPRCRRYPNAVVEIDLAPFRVEDLAQPARRQRDELKAPVARRGAQPWPPWTVPGAHARDALASEQGYLRTDNDERSP